MRANKSTNDEQPEATYDPEKIFQGWKYSSDEYFDNLVEKWYQLEDEKMTPRVYQQATRKFRKKFEDYPFEKKQEFYIDYSDAAVLARPGERGSGKSWDMRGSSDRASMAGVLSVIIDPEHEHFTKNYESGIQKSELRASAGHRANEEPSKIDTLVLMPSFIKKAREKAQLDEDGKRWWRTFRFSLQDFKTTMIEYLFMNNISGESRISDFQNYVSRLNQRIESGKAEDLEDCKALAEEMQQEGEFEYDERAREIYTRKISKFENWNLIDDKYNVDWKNVVEEYDSIVLSLEDDDECPRNLELRQLAVALIIDKFRNLAKRDIIDRPVQWHIDEAHEFVLKEDPDSKQDMPPGHFQIRKLIKKDRKLGFRLEIGSQEITDIPEDNFLKQTDHWVLPSNIDQKTKKYILDDILGVWEQGDKARKKWKRIFDAMGSHDKLYVRDKTDEWFILTPPAPITNHLNKDNG